MHDSSRARPLRKPWSTLSARPSSFPALASGRSILSSKRAASNALKPGAEALKFVGLPPRDGYLFDILELGHAVQIAHSGFGVMRSGRAATTPLSALILRSAAHSLRRHSGARPKAVNPESIIQSRDVGFRAARRIGPRFATTRNDGGENVACRMGRATRDPSPCPCATSIGFAVFTIGPCLARTRWFNPWPRHALKQEWTLMADAQQHPRTLSGQCLCGAVRYTVADTFRYAMNCHCSNCRRTPGAAFKPFAGIERDRLSIVAGQDATMIYGEPSNHDPALRTSAARCSIRSCATAPSCMSRWVR